MTRTTNNSLEKLFHGIMAVTSITVFILSVHILGMFELRHPGFEGSIGGGDGGDGRAVSLSATTATTQSLEQTQRLIDNQHIHSFPMIRVERPQRQQQQQQQQQHDLGVSTQIETTELTKLGCRDDPGKGTEGRTGYLLLEKIHYGMLESKENEEIRGHSPRILCMVHTHSERMDYLKAVIDTWGTSCDGFIAFSNHTDTYTNSIDLPLLQKDGNQTRGEEIDLWQKIQSMWSYIHDKYLDSYDYFHL